MTSIAHNRPAARALNVAGFLLTAGALLFGVLYLEKTLFLEPCPLCLINRAFLGAMSLMFIVAAVHNPALRGQRVYGSVNLLLAFGGIATAARHVWLQHLPADQAPECGAGLAYMLENLPWLETLQRVVQGSGECAEVQWTFLGLSIAELTLLLLIGLALMVLVQLRAKKAG